MNILPEFNQHGDLPPGVHTATIEEILNRFAGTPRRAVVAVVWNESIHWLARPATSRDSLSSVRLLRPKPNPTTLTFFC